MWIMHLKISEHTTCLSGKDSWETHHKSLDWRRKNTRGTHWSCETSSRYSHFSDRPTRTHPQREIKTSSPHPSWPLALHLISTVSLYDHQESILLLLIDHCGLLTSSLVLLRLYPQFTAMSKGLISVQPFAVQVLERLPAHGEDMKRSHRPPRL